MERGRRAKAMVDEVEGTFGPAPSTASAPTSAGRHPLTAVAAITKERARYAWARTTSSTALPHP